MDGLIEIGGVLVDASRVVAVERGMWENHAQDWRAILVFDAGARVSVDLFVGQAATELKCCDAPNQQSAEKGGLASDRLLRSTVSWTIT